MISDQKEDDQLDLDLISGQNEDDQLDLVLISDQKRTIWSGSVTKRKTIS
jgi:hypothetical protein